MHISRFRAGNYKSFYESEPLELGPGFNVIVGPNNVGKTALLEVLSLRFGSNPHRSPKTIPAPDINPPAPSWIEVSVTLTRNELLDLLQTGTPPYWIPLARYDTEIARRAGLQVNGPEDMKRFVHAVFENDSFTFALKRENGPWRSAVLPSFGLYPALTPGANQQAATSFGIGPGRTIVPTGGFSNIYDQTEIGAHLGPILERYVYKFSAERFNVGAAAFGHDAQLAPDAHNLPEVLNCLQPNKDKFEKFNGFVRAIFPHIRWVSAQPTANNLVEIRVWVFDPESQRLDLARPLAQSGTGIGQVLAILYVAINSPRPQIIIIDEPQSFLHPGAVRKLIDILRTHTQHQYILSTHSPTVITSADPSTITLVRLVDGESHLQPINVRETKAASAYLSEIGARLSDVFGADDFLWVEGATEEMCFPMILEKVAKLPLMGTAIIGVRQVGDFEGRHAKRILEIYNRLCQSKSLIPPAVGFIFDSECRTATEKAELSRLGKGRVFFLRRRMFENYLLNPQAIAEVLSRLDVSRPAPIEPAEVAALIEELKTNEDLFRPAPLDPGAEWFRYIHGGELLDRIFTRLSDTRVKFEKPEHSVALSEWIIEKDPESLREVAELLVEALKKPTA